MKIRIFYALIIPDEIINFIISLRNDLSKNSTNIRWEPEEKLHITLKFIGDVDEKKLTDIHKELLEIEKEVHYYKCQLKNFEFLYRNGKPSILWMGLIVEPTLDKLVNKLNSIFKSFGIEEEKRKFKPHITLLRLKNNPGELFIKTFNEYVFPANSFIANKTALIKSELLSAGSIYTELNTYTLKNKEDL